MSINHFMAGMIAETKVNGDTLIRHQAQNNDYFLIVCNSPAKHMLAHQQNRGSNKTIHLL